MKKRIAAIALLFVALTLATSAALSFVDPAPAPIYDASASSARFALLGDLLLTGQEHSIRQCSDAEEKPSPICAPFQLAFAPASPLFLHGSLFCDAHFKKRAFQIQTARWCAS